MADSAFYSMVARYLDRARAPHGARAGIAFLRGLAAWDWKAVSAQVDTLISYERRHTPWVSASVLRSGGVVARLRLGDVAGARAVFDQLTPVLPFRAGDVRTMLLDAWIRAAADIEGRRSGAASPGVPNPGPAVP